MKLLNCDIFEFIEYISGKQLICFGAGLTLQWFNLFCNDLTIKFQDYIKYVCDNDPFKCGKTVSIGGKEIPIINVEQLKDFCNIIILITNMQICDVFEQLDAVDEFTDIDCFVCAYVEVATTEMLERKRKYPMNFRRYEKPIIPKKIHYCWFGKKSIPEQNRKWMESWHRYCPDYEIIEWNENNYDISKNKYMQQAYESKKWGFVPDYARLDIIYNYGGIYLDTDVEVIKNLDDLLYQDAFAGVDDSQMVSLGLGFGAQKGNYLIETLRNEYDNFLFWNQDGSYNMTAAPRLQASIFNQLGYINNGEFQIINGMAIYPQKVLSPKCNLTGVIDVTENTFAIHHYDGSWVSTEKKKIEEKNRRLWARVQGIKEK